MADDPSHKAMLYFLEILMNSDSALSISQLAGRFSSRSFTLEMRAASGGNEQGLRKFLLQYPSLWTVKGNLVSLYNSDKETVPCSPKTPVSRQNNDISIELEAVKYFQNTLLKRTVDERWVEVKRIAGHLSQAPLAVRQACGPQLEFRDWLLKHPHIFDVQGELVGLREGISVQSTSSNGFHKAPSTPSFTNRSRPTSGIYTPPSILRRSHSFSEKRHNQNNNSPPEKQNDSETVNMNMPAAEFKALNYLKTLILAIGTMPQVDLQAKLSSDAPDSIRSAIGWTSPDLTRFLKKHHLVFIVDSTNMVSVKSNTNVNTTISRSSMSGSSMAAIAANALAACQNSVHSRVMEGGSGVIYHVAKLWGIVDLGKHEHVFFDRSIMLKPLDDLQKFYKVGEILYFNAVQAPINSRAKWKATRVWKCSEEEQEEQDEGANKTNVDQISPSNRSHGRNAATSPTSTTSSSSSTGSKYSNNNNIKNNNNEQSSPAQEVEVEKQMKSFFDSEKGSDSAGSTIVDIYADVPASGAGAVPVYNFKPTSNEPCMRRATMVPEMYHMAYELLNSIRNPGNPSTPSAPGDGSTSNAGKSRDACTQTTSTGSIIASAIY